MENTTTMQRLLIVDDDNDIRQLLAEQLGRAGYQVSTASDGQGMRQVLEREHVDLIVLDLNLPREDGLTLCRDLRARSTTPVIMLTARSEPIDRVLGLEMGADDYLGKPFDFREFEARCRVLLRRARGQASEVVQIGGFQFDNASHRVSLDGQPIELPNREYRLLEILMGRLGHVVGKDEIGNGLFGFDDEAGPNAIELYVGRLRKKLADAPLRIVTVRGSGYLLEAIDGTPDAEG